MKREFSALGLQLKHAIYPILLSSCLFTTSFLIGNDTVGLDLINQGKHKCHKHHKSSSSSSSNEDTFGLDYPNVRARQINYADINLADENRVEFYSVWPNDYYINFGATGFFNTFIPTNVVANPKNASNLIANYGGDRVAINEIPAFPSNRRNNFTYSKDSGETWTLSLLPTLNLSQSAGSIASFSSKGDTIYALGFFADTYTNPLSGKTGLFDFTYYTSYLPQPYGPASIFDPTGPILVNSPSVQVSRNNLPIDPNTDIAATITSFGFTGTTANPAAGLFLSRSKDGGKSFSKPVIVSATQTNTYFGFLSGGTTGTIEGGNGLVDSTGSLIIDSCNSKILNVLWARVDNVSFLWGSIYNSRSTNGGKSFTTNPKGDNKLTNITASPLYALAFDANFATQIINTDPNYLTNFPNVGQAANVGGIIVKDVGQGGNHGKPVYLAGITRIYPQPNQTVPTFSDAPTDSFTDHAVIISKDKGKTWGDGTTFSASKVNAVALPQYIFASAHDPRLATAPIGLLIFDGALNETLAASPKTGRVYYAWEGGNSTLFADPSVNQFYPEIQLSVSSGSLDTIGQNWTAPVKINQTPNNFANPATSQAFNCNVAVNKNGIVGVVYSDFRNFDVTQIGDPEGTVLTTTWIAFFQELKSPTDGEYGNGLTFIAEYQVSPIFDSSVAGGTPFTGITAGGILTIDVDANGNFVVGYPVTNVNQGTNPIPQVPNYPPYSSYNIFENTSNRVNSFVKVIPAPSLK